MDFIYLFRILLKRKWVILGSAVLSAAIAYFLTMNQAKYYRSRAQMSTGFTISDEIRVNDANFSFFEADTKFSNAIAICTSPAVISLVSYKLIIHDLEETQPFTNLSEDQKKTTLYKSIRPQDAIRLFSKKLESMAMLRLFDPEEKKLHEYLRLYGYDIESISKKLSVNRLDRTDYIQIDFISFNPEMSAFVVNTLYEQFLGYYRNIRSSNSEESIDTLKSLMDKKRQDWEIKNSGLKGEGFVDPEQRNVSNLELISTLEQTLNEEKGKRIDLVSSIRKINQKLAAIPAQGSLKNQNEANELMILRNEMNDTYKQYVNSGSTDNNLLAKYNRLKSAYQSKYASSGALTSPDGKNQAANQKDLQDQKNDLEVDIDASNTRIASIENKINSLKGVVVSDANKGATVESLIKEADLANKEYLAAKQKYNDAKDKSTSSINNFRQVLVGQPAIDPEPSKRKLIVGMAGVAAFLTTMLIFIILALMDSSIKTPVIFSKMVNLKLISMVNFMNLKHASLANLVANIDGHESDEDKKRHNIFRESLRKLRFEIENSGKRIFLFTSNMKSEGKTTLIQALAYSMSLSKKKILIIDTNFCNNDLTVRTNAKPVLEKMAGYDPVKDDLLQKVKEASTDIGAGSVFVIGSEGGDYTPSEVLPREHLLLHLSELRKEYDYIFLEGPPLNDYSDSRELAKYVEGVIAVFSANHIIKQIDKQSLIFYTELKDKFCGAVLNMVDLENVNVT